MREQRSSAGSRSLAVCLFGLAGLKTGGADGPTASDRLLFHASSAKLVKTSRPAAQRWLLRGGGGNSHARKSASSRLNPCFTPSSLFRFKARSGAKAKTRPFPQSLAFNTSTTWLFSHVIFSSMVAVFSTLLPKWNPLQEDGRETERK